MSLGLYETDQRRRRQRRWGVIRRFFFLFLLALAAWLAYMAGRTLQDGELEHLRLKSERHESEMEQLTSENARLNGRAQLLEEELSALKQRYKRDVPQEIMAEMLAIAQAKLAEGVPLERLRFLLRSASVVRDCDDATDIKRFIVRTSLSTGGNDAIDFAQGRLTVTAKGESARNDSGAPEAWFDVEQPIIVTVARIGGGAETHQGLLPLQFSVVLGDSEHLFSIKAGEQRGFAEVIEQVCAYP